MGTQYILIIAKALIGVLVRAGSFMQLLRPFLHVIMNYVSNKTNKITILFNMRIVILTCTMAKITLYWIGMLT